MSPRKLVLVGWDGADWRLINPLLDRGEMPNLARLVSGGVMGNLATLQPMLSPMIWTAIATGKMPDRHGILGFLEVDGHSGEVRPSTSLSRRVKAVWNILTQTGHRTHAVNWFCSHPAEPISGVCVSELFCRLIRRPPDAKGSMPAGVVHPARLEEALAQCLVGPREIDAEVVSLFVPRFREVDQAKDGRLVAIAVTLAETFSVHAALTWALEHEPWDFVAVYYHAIDHFCHAFLRYHPPRLASVGKADFDLYSDVVNSAYRLQDLLLGRLLALAGDEATVVLCSDHGFQVGDLRPGRLAAVPVAAAEEHRPIGVFAMKGPGIKRDQLVHGARVLDVTPTILALFGLPVGEDMDGRPLVEGFEDTSRPVATIPSLETAEGACGRHPPDTRVEPREQRALLDQFVALGYVDSEDAKDSAPARALAIVERDWNLARVLMTSGHYAKALPILEDLQDRYPLRFDFGMALAECQFRLGLGDAAAQVAQDLAAVYPGQVRARMLLGLAAHYRGDRKAALDHLAAVAAVRPRLPAFHVQLGTVYLLLGRTAEALHAFEEALHLDPDSPTAHLGVAKCRLRLQENSQAAGAALRALGLDFSLADAHWVLGVALARVGRVDEAISALEACLRLAPGRGGVHGLLAILYGGRRDGAERARDHRARFEAFRRGRGDRQRRIFEIQTAARRRANARARRRAEEEAQLAQAASGLNLTSDVVDTAAGRVPMREPGASGKELVIVSGLPRSGTSMMMQMLAAGGAPVMVDDSRTADESNPEGYYEWEGAKRLLRNPAAIEEAQGRVVKVVSLLLGRLPRARRYKVVFMRRPVEEMIASQRKMLARAGVAQPLADSTRLQRLAASHQQAVIERLEELPYVDVLVVDHGEALSRPAETADRVARFLGPAWISTPSAMAAVVKPELWRERSGAANGATV